MARLYTKKPSELVGELDPYTAFCFDEACMFIMHRIDEGETPQFRKKVSSFTELYKDYA